MTCKTLKEVTPRAWEDGSVVKCFTLQAQGPEFESLIPRQKAGITAHAQYPRARGWRRRQKDPWDSTAILVKSVPCSVRFPSKNMVRIKDAQHGPPASTGTHEHVPDPHTLFANGRAKPVHGTGVGYCATISE